MSEVSMTLEGRKALEKELKGIIKRFDVKTTQRIFNKASKAYVNKVRGSAPKAGRVVKRYNTPKSFSNKRAPRGMGNVVAEYHPGNLGRSFKRLRFRGSSKFRAVFIGPKKSRNGKGVFRTVGKSDGFYARFLGDDSYIKAAWDGTRDAVLRSVIAEFKKLLR